MKNCHILKVDSFDIGNGPGIRTTVWMAGCSHHCLGCHNPETWRWKNNGKELTQEIIEKILKSCEPDYVKGMTLTGGDPLFIRNQKGTIALCKAFREKFGYSKNIWLWTGSTYEDIGSDIKDLVDYIVDGEYIQDLRDPSAPYTGSLNQRAIKVWRK